MKNEQIDMTKPCGCGRPARYMVKIESGAFVNACNKYMRCPTYEELQLTIKTRQNEIRQLDGLIETNRTAFQDLTVYLTEQVNQKTERVLELENENNELRNTIAGMGKKCI